MTIKALIAARAGSVRVKNKNIRPFAGSTLLEIKIQQMMRIPELDGVVVNSNSDEMLGMAARLGAETVKRDEFFATSEISVNEFYANIAEHFNADTVLLTYCTSPLVRDETYSAAIKVYNNLSDRYDSLLSVSPLKEFLWIDGKAANYDLHHKPRSQDLPDNYVILNSAIHILPRDMMIQRKDCAGENPYLFPLSAEEDADIDNEIDFDFAEFMYKKRNNL